MNSSQTVVYVREGDASTKHARQHDMNLSTIYRTLNLCPTRYTPKIEMTNKNDAETLTPIRPRVVVVRKSGLAGDASCTRRGEYPNGSCREITSVGES